DRQVSRLHGHTARGCADKYRGVSDGIHVPVEFVNGRINGTTGTYVEGVSRPIWRLAASLLAGCIEPGFQISTIHGREALHSGFRFLRLLRPILTIGGGGDGGDAIGSHTSGRNQCEHDHEDSEHVWLRHGRLLMKAYFCL